MTRIAFGARVVDSEGKAVGTVRGLVVRPDTRQVDGLVVHQGIMQSRDVVVPIGKVTGDQSIRLALKAVDLNILPIFNAQARLTARDTERKVVFSFGRTTALVPRVPDPAFWSGESTSEEPARPDVRKGTAVCDNTGHRIGHVDALDMDLASRTITDIIVRRGYLFARKVIIPASLIKSVADRITLNISVEDARRLESL